VLPPSILHIARRLSASGGRALLVGGYVRDRLLGLEPKDLDVEVFGLPLERVEAILGETGEVITIGRSFGVLRVKGLDVDFSLPRLDSKVGEGHKGFEVRTDPGLPYAEAARRRDLTINSMAFDPLTEEILDPHGGRRDLEARVLRAVDATHFGEDPLRGVRVGQLAARFEMQPDAGLRALCRGLDLSELSGERILEEMRKLLLKGRVPSLGLRVFEDVGYLRYFPELAALVGVPQDPEWHPEGDVWVHTCMVVDQAAKLRDGGPDDEALMFGALCHDLGKPSTTVVEREHVRSPAHDVAGVPLARALLERWRAPNELMERVAGLVEHHLAPALFVKGDAGPHGYRRLARKLGAAGVSLELLVRLARADHLGRTTQEALAGDCSMLEKFLARAHELLIVREAPRDVVLGRHLIARGMQPGPRFGEILARCRDVQDETGSTDPDRILEIVLGAQP
jgi:tRNA nucleotidyltransferase (CCA-adding enzyme)